MQRDKQALNTGKRYKKPSERAARFVLGIFEWLRDIFHSPMTTLPSGQVVQHSGQELTAGESIRYPCILLVEDNPVNAEQFVGAIKSYYLYGSVSIFVAYRYGAAVTYFENENINLVIMDADLDDDEGDGSMLTQKFLGERPEITILANSSNKLSNLKLTGFGAIETLGKSPVKLHSWLLLNDPTGNRGC